MAFSIKNDDADRAGPPARGHHRRVPHQAVLVALRERLQREEARRRVGWAIGCAGWPLRWPTLPVLDDRSAEEILGYDDRGLPA